jgi:phosphonoacetaldehyde hydrolase
MNIPVKAVIFDWAGTMVDFGCMAPVHALINTFAAEGLPITAAEARRDMGRAKLDHLRAILADPGVAARWLKAKGAQANEADVARIYAALEIAMTEAATASATMIPGAVETFQWLKARGVRIGSGTGYTREMMAGIEAAAAAQGYTPEVIVCAGDTPSGRPAPLMTWKALIALDAWPARACVKVDDSPVGIEEGRLAGCWTVGISASGNAVGLDVADYYALVPEDRTRRVAAAEAELRAAGADFVIPDVSALPAVIETIAARLAEEMA